MPFEVRARLQPLGCRKSFKNLVKSGAGGRDLRVVATDGEPVAAMARSSDHWLTNAAKGAEVEAIEVTDEMRDLVERASAAVGGGLLGVDLMETGDDYTVHEVNHTVEFKALNEAVGDAVDVPATVVDWLEEVEAPVFALDLFSATGGVLRADRSPAATPSFAAASLWTTSAGFSRGTRSARPPGIGFLNPTRRRPSGVAASPSMFSPPSSLGARLAARARSYSASESCSTNTVRRFLYGAPASRSCGRGR